MACIETGGCAVDGLVQYVAVIANNTVPGFVVPNTQFGVPYIEFTASDNARGQVAVFNGGKPPPPPLPVFSPHKRTCVISASKFETNFGGMVSSWPSISTG